VRDCSAVKTVEMWTDEAQAAARHGDLLRCFDILQHALVEHPGELELCARAIDVLLRIGGTRRASALFEAYGYVGHESPRIKYLEARLHRDLALGATGEERTRHAREAAALYEAVFAVTRQSHAAINAATLLRMSGEVPRSEALARQARECVRSEPAATPNLAFFALATEAEAALLLGEPGVDAILARARELGADEEAHTVIRTKLLALCAILGVDAAVLAPLDPTAILHYGGHRLGKQFPPEQEATVAARIATELARLNIGHGIGALAAGADILFAEALIARGARLDVVLPFGEDDYCATSVRKDGEAWVARYRACLAYERCHVTRVTNDNYRSDPLPFMHASHVAMGMAVLRARFLRTRAHQILVWDRDAPSHGLEAAARAWHALSAEITTPAVVIAPRDPETLRFVEEPIPVSPPMQTKRVLRTMLFADVKGFSRLEEDRVPTFFKRVMNPLARVIDRYKEAALFSWNTWGDGLYLVFHRPRDAAACALELQRAMPSRATLVNAQLPVEMSLRIGIHIGPVFELRDEVLDRMAAVGTEVTRTARIEPITPPGEAFVTLPFAAHLSLETDAFACDYAGEQPMAKGYGSNRMYLLRQRVPVGPRGG